MEVTVKHKKGKFRSDWNSLIRVAWKMFFSNEVTVVVTFKANIIDLVSTYDWLKICGWKSGVKTENNTEEIAAYRKWEDKNMIDHIEFGVYRRSEIMHDMWFVSEDNKPQDISDNVWEYKIRYTLKRPKGCWIPVFPWAGGDELPENYFEYKLEML